MYILLGLHIDILDGSIHEVFGFSKCFCIPGTFLLLNLTYIVNRKYLLCTHWLTYYMHLAHMADFSMRWEDAGGTATYLSALQDGSRVRNASIKKPQSKYTGLLIRYTV